MSGTPVGLLRLGTIVGYDDFKGTISVNLDHSGDGVKVPSIQIPFSFYSVDGLFIGGYPTPGTPVVVGQGEGGKFYFVSYAFNQQLKVKSSSLSQTRSGKIQLDPGTLVLQSSHNTSIKLSENAITIGNSLNSFTYNTYDNFINSNFDSQYSFTQASRSVIGPILRDLEPNKNYPDFLKLSDPDYQSKLKQIGMDPKLRSGVGVGGALKNPPFVEKRELVYEFEFASDVKDDISESNIYDPSNIKKAKYFLPNRRLSQSDTLSLSLVAPNYLMETVKGTVVDIFGNILDINRSPIQVGIKDLSLKSNENSLNKRDVFFNIKAAERNSLALHFEINARKDLVNGKLPDINSSANYSRSRSRFSFDVTKEGVFKLNVPASSSIGTVPLLVRAENYSTYGPEDSGNPNKLVFRPDNLDLFLDSFAYKGGTITIKDGYNEVTPIDRLLNQHIKHGTVYHDIVNTCQSFQTPLTLQSQHNKKAVDLSLIPIYYPIVSNTIKLNSSDSNANGRSGVINMDGSIELNLGANIIDKQSLWLDFQGGIVGNIGRDRQGISSAISSTGDILVEIGGVDTGAENDDRFVAFKDVFRGGALDIRVRHNGSQYTIFRIDDAGVTVISPSRITLSSNKQISINSSSDIDITGENVTIQGRLVDKGRRNKI